MSQPDFFDITRPVGPTTPVWPGDPPMRLEWVSRRSEGAVVNIASLQFGVHVGTHADAPYHVSDTGLRIGQVDLERWIGPAVVVEASGGDVDTDLVARVLSEYPAAERLLFRTGAWRVSSTFPTEFPALTPAAAKLIVEAGVLLVGTDAPSIDPFDSAVLPAHHAFAEAGIVNLENLLLDSIPPGEYELIALPLALQEADGSPVRAVLRRL